jgi:hypothetical protein
MTAPNITLPTLEEIDAADDKICSVLSRVDEFVMLAEKIDQAGVVSLADYQMSERGIALDDDPEFLFEPASFLRLLVLATDRQEDAERLRADAQKLEETLRAVYHKHLDEEERPPGGVLDRPGRSVSRECARRTGAPHRTGRRLLLSAAPDGVVSLLMANDRREHREPGQETPPPRLALTGRLY